jgi:hypothetical protein
MTDAERRLLISTASVLAQFNAHSDPALATGLTADDWDFLLSQQPAKFSGEAMPIRLVRLMREVVAERTE